MAKKKAVKTKKTVAKPTKKKVGKAYMLIGFFFVAGAIFLPTTMLLAVGMLPTLVAVFVAPERRGSKALAVGAMNFAGCSAFLIELWKSGHSFQKSLEIISDPMAIIVMFAAAAVGYALDWMVSGAVAGVLHQTGMSRKKAIKSKQQELISRWGKEVAQDADQE